VAICRICGASYDERAYQVAITLLNESFDSVDCAELAVARHLREASRRNEVSATPRDVELHGRLDEPEPPS
jgi:hypothetical protein